MKLSGNSIRKTDYLQAHSFTFSSLPFLSLSFPLPAHQLTVGVSLFQLNQIIFCHNLHDPITSLPSKFKTVPLSAAVSCHFNQIDVTLLHPLHLHNTSIQIFSHCSSPPPPVSELHRGDNLLHLMASLPPLNNGIPKQSNRQRLLSYLPILLCIMSKTLFDHSLRLFSI